jgi:ribulose-5-phosphate 4-epimerase/fuculose-1-phosphate aldolase
MTSHDDDELRSTVATACRVLAAEGLVDGVLGHVSARVGESELVIRCRGPEERGMSRTTRGDVWRATFDGGSVDLPPDYAVPNELAIHAELLRARPELGAVIHAHPPAALFAGLAGLRPRAVFGAYNIPALRLALDGVPVYERSVLITRAELAREMVDAMAGADTCLLRGHGITVAGATVEQATVLAVNLNVLLHVTVELARLGAKPPELDDRDLRELPDLGSSFNDEMAWRALVAGLGDA